jgi:Family of unknown function (DUF6368)
VAPRELTPEDDGWWRPRESRLLGKADLAGEAGAIAVEVAAWQADDPQEARSLRMSVGFLPRAEIVLAAAVNGDEDHRLLAHLAIALARRHNGLNDLCGPVPTPVPPGVPVLEPTAGQY